ncbi:MAG: V/A-type H+/Na+-transporting ATPase subunit [Bacteroidales bacterium]|jgi:V/A-type H+-transporting ATPase subunit E|nr:V/A-type H+/Na+-transporting ATPase subunit [Bacteroidales bacterium]
MENKLQELTQKLYNEGVEKANEEADKIIKEAKAEADKIKKNAEKEAKGIIEEAEQKSEEIRKNVQAELELASKQTVRKVKQQITDLITSKVIDEPVKKAFDDEKFVKEIIETIIKNWDPQKKESVSLSVLLPEKLEKEFEKYFKTKTGKELNAKLELSFSDAVKGGFKIGPADNSYKISFTEEDFINFFKSYLRPKTGEMLFQGE